jgi:hypothetical protein
MVGSKDFNKLKSLNDYMKNFEKIQKSYVQSGYFQFMKSVQENINRIENSAISKFVYQVQEDMKKFENSYVGKLMDQVSQVSKRFEDLGLNKTFEQIQDLSKSYSQMLEKNNYVAQTMNTYVNQIENSVSLINNSVLRSIEKFSNVSQIIEGSTLSIKLIDIVNNLENYDTIDYVLEDVNTTITKQTRKQKPNYITYINLENFIYFLLTIIFTIFYSKISNEELIEHISNSEKTLIEEIRKLIPKNTELQDLYVVTHNLNVRSGPSKRKLAIDKLYPNQEVIVQKVEGNWYYIEYYDYVKDIPKTGWVYKRYIKQISYNK